jgi:hypothetical protein
MEPEEPYLLVLRRGDVDAIIVDDPPILRAVRQLIAQHLSPSAPQEAPAAPWRLHPVRGPGAPDDGAGL